MNKDNALSEKAYRLIKESLINYENGKYLSARSYADEIGMSYTPVRDAFIRLQREGFMERIPNVGFFVARLDIQDIIKIYQVRECVEVFIFEAVFDVIKSEHIQALMTLSEKQKEALKANDIRQYIKVDEQFHSVFLDIYGNEHLSSLVKNVRERYMFCSKKIAMSNSADGIDEHDQIIQHIKENNKTEAVQMMASHIENAKHRMKEGFISEQNI